MRTAILTTLALAATAALGLARTAPDEITVTVESLPFDPAALARSDRPPVRIQVEEDGKAVVYSGIPLRVVLESKLAGRGADAMKDLRRLSDSVLLVRGSDGYRAAVSAAAVAMDEKGDRFLLALERDGRPLGEGQGPVRLVVPGDARRVRWVRAVSAIDLVRLSEAGAKAGR